MLRVKSRRWLFAAAVLPLILAACTSMAGRPGAGTGTVAGSGSAAPRGLRAVRHVWVIELENQGYQQSFGGGRIGAVLLSPLIRPGTVSTVAYNHYSLLRSIEDIFGLPHLGDAAMPQVRSFGPDVFG